jgi:hypothetical protein
MNISRRGGSTTRSCLFSYTVANWCRWTRKPVNSAVPVPVKSTGGQKNHEIYDLPSTRSGINWNISWGVCSQKFPWGLQSNFYSVTKISPQVASCQASNHNRNPEPRVRENHKTESRKTDSGTVCRKTPSPGGRRTHARACARASRASHACAYILKKYMHPRPRARRFTAI